MGFFQVRAAKLLFCSTLAVLLAPIVIRQPDVATAQDARPANLPSPKLVPAPPQPASFPLYPGGAPLAVVPGGKERWNSFGSEKIVRNVVVPTLTPFLPAPGKATGAAVIVAPGGGFMILSIENEGWDVAKWLAAHGIAAFVLKYRVQPTPEDEEQFEKFAVAKLFRPLAPGEKRVQTGYEPAIQDAMAALKLVRARAGDWKIDPERTGIVGFSAGAATALGATLAAKGSVMPAFVGLLYTPPPGPIALPSEAPPLFAAVAADDHVVGPDTSVVEAWRAAGRPVEFHLYGRGGHGFGMRKSGATSDLWPDEFLAWLNSSGFLTSKESPQR